MSSFKTREEHWLVLVDFMEKHPDFACGRLSTPSARSKFNELWRELANKLNSLGYGERSWEKWNKSWSDYRSNLKQKASQIKKWQSQTGGGPSINKKLSEMELRVLNIMGNMSYEGCGTKEVGLEMTSITNKEDDSDQGSEVRTSLDSKDQNNRLVNPDKDSNTSNSGKRNAVIDDHDYLLQNKRIKTTPGRNTTMQEAYSETITVLRSIENTLKEGLKDINSSLQNISSAIREKK